MAKKARKKGGQVTRAQQQQDAAAKRHAAAHATGRERSAQVSAVAPKPAAEDARSTRINYYLDVSAVRIQDWLARTPDLRFRRGASILLTQATARDAWTKLPPGVRWNEEAGELDGVVTLVVDESVPESEAESCVQAAALLAAQRIRATLPYCPVHAVTGAGDSYATAYEQMEQARRSGQFVADSPLAPPEVILAKPCDQCRSAPAVRSGVIVVAGRTQDLCADCYARFEATGGTKGDRTARSPLPERRMREALTAAGMDVRGFPDDFSTMATAGQLDLDDSATQLALLYADGNKVGAFLNEAAKAASRGGRPAKAEIVTALDDATLASLADAIMSRYTGWSRPPVLANLAGGDDILVSLPAVDAWLFVRTLLEAFGQRIDAATRQWPGNVRSLLPSLSAGMVFHHMTSPFSDVVRLVEDQLRLAKQTGRGEPPAVAFLDLTADGGQAPPGRRPLTLAYLTENEKLLERVEQIPKSRRETLVTLHRQAFENDDSANDPNTETPADEFIRRLTDLDNRPLWEAVAGPGATAASTRETLTDQPETLSDLRRLLDVARYWHTEPRMEPEREVVSR